MAERRSLLGEEQEQEQDQDQRRRVDVFGDEFAVDEEDVAVADGFRPADDNEARVSHEDDNRSPEIRTASPYYSPDPVSPPGLSRDSTRKSRGAPDPLASPSERVEPPLRRTPSGNFTASRAHRAMSSASSSLFASTQGAAFASSGPSHPYGMYPQGTVTRTASVVTASTAQRQRHSSTRNGPAHPYALYTQGVGDELDREETPTPPNLVPVGFLGLGQSYQRQVGPEGEEQGLIGDFGHTEQLPPYTRYPEDGPDKVPLLEPPDPPTALHSRAPVQGSDPSNPIMHVQVQLDPRQSMTDRSLLEGQERRPSVMSRRSLLPLQDRPASGSILESQPWYRTSWRRRKTTRVCGVPLMWFLGAVGAIVFGCALLGGVVGGYFVGREKGAETASSTAALELYDATVVTTAATSAPSATGDFALALNSPEGVDNRCLSNSSQRKSWSCTFAGKPDTMISVGTQAGSNQSGAFLYPGNPRSMPLKYGIQGNSLSTQHAPFLLVTDRDEPGHGNAYYFQQMYDKVVVIPEWALSPQTNESNVEELEEWASDHDPTEGDQPWFCYWNSTFLAVFIYDDVARSTSTTSAALASPTASLGDGDGEYDDYVPAEAMMAGMEHKVRIAREYRRGRHPIAARNAAHVYPHVVKIEERRVPGSPAPYCVQNQLLSGGTWGTLPDPDDDTRPVTVQLVEDIGGPTASDATASASPLQGTDDDMPGCHCQWMAA